MRGFMKIFMEMFLRYTLNYPINQGTCVWRGDHCAVSDNLQDNIDNGSIPAALPHAPILDPLSPVGGPPLSPESELFNYFN